jgi:hypothetical protein
MAVAILCMHDFDMGLTNAELEMIGMANQEHLTHRACSVNKETESNLTNHVC